MVVIVYCRLTQRAQRIKDQQRVKGKKKGLHLELVWLLVQAFVKG